jgi:hypothetical protein
VNTISRCRRVGRDWCRVFVGKAIALVPSWYALLPAFEGVQHVSDSGGDSLRTDWKDCILLGDMSHETWPRPGLAVHWIFKVLESAVALVCRRAVPVGRCSWACLSSHACPGCLFVCLSLESGSHSFVPGLHCIIWLVRKALFGQHLGEDAA